MVDKEVAQLEEQLKSAMQLLQEMKTKEIKLLGDTDDQNILERAKSETLKQMESQVLKIKNEIKTCHR